MQVVVLLIYLKLRALQSVL